MQIKGVLSGQILAEVPFQITNLAVKTGPPTAAFHKVVNYTFAGFRPGQADLRPLLPRQASSSSPTSSARPPAPAASSQTKAKLFPGNGPRGAKYKVQFDDSKKVNPKASPEDRHLPGRRLLT